MGRIVVAAYRLKPGKDGAHRTPAVHQDAENPSRLVLVGQWTDREALSAHFAVPASRAFVTAVGNLAVARPEISIYEALPVKP